VFVQTPNYNVRAFGSNSILTINGQMIEYVNQYPHLGRIISVNWDDTQDITQRRNKLCGQINNVLCFFSNCDAFIKVKLHISYCYSIYGRVIWDLGNPSVEFICRTRRKGLRSALGLPIDASSKLLPGLSGTLPIIDELYKR
jgi:hypothetical protein